jgi:hypothetical protein
MRGAARSGGDADADGRLVLLERFADGDTEIVIKAPNRGGVDL